MNCSVCGTRIGNKERNCPACGRSVANQSSRAESSDSSGGSKGQRLSPSSAKVPDSREGLRDSSSRAPGRTRKKKKASKPNIEPEMTLETPVEEGEGDSFSGSPVEAAQIRELILDRPDCLEAGLSIYTDSDAEPVGIDFETEVGLIDLLARDDAGGLVVVMIAPGAAQESGGVGKELVSMALERVGWVSKHVAKPQQEVRAIVLLEQVPDDISYTAAAVASTVAFKTYRMEISFSEVDV